MNYKTNPNNRMHSDSMLVVQRVYDAVYVTVLGKRKSPV